MKSLPKPSYEKSADERPLVPNRSRKMRKLGHDLTSHSVLPLPPKKRRTSPLTSSTTDSDTSSDDRNLLLCNSPSREERNSRQWRYCGLMNDLKISESDNALRESDSIIAVAPLSPRPDSCRKLSPHLQSELDKCENELKVSIMKFGPEHPETATILNRIGLLYQHMIRDHVKALAYHGEAIRILGKESSTSESSSSSLLKQKAFVLGDVAQLHEARHDRRDALSKYWDALQLFDDINLCEKNPRVLSTKQAIKRLCRCSSATREGCSCYATYT